ncbi:MULTISPECIES: hypothetical protein [unclassified Coleofasciculus]|uniref:hypothetical protein n=1 Tax=unclassified Coleofasciculus TaxID=2692782 RepID=UPI001880A890|nr:MULTISPECIES: hypothetical protein [unclassified Coleofasciculus]MBE9127180.1 hypothetical protein [Coleofasciculus sp. LEGE 07081]MBE9150501.1 hypothetical protein [Coleofasciculus sp. LEGE 07092]
MLTIKTFVQTLNAFHWSTDYKEFCQVLNLDEGQYSLEKYKHFENLCKALNEFDSESLAKLIEAGTIAERTVTKTYSN